MEHMHVDEEPVGAPVAGSGLETLRPADFFGLREDRSDRRVHRRYAMTAAAVHQAIAAFIVQGEYDLDVIAHHMGWHVEDFYAADEQAAGEIETLRRQWNNDSDPVRVIRPYRCRKCGAGLSLVPCVLCFCERGEG